MEFTNHHTSGFAGGPAAGPPQPNRRRLLSRKEKRVLQREAREAREREAQEREARGARARSGAAGQLSSMAQQYPDIVQNISEYLTLRQINRMGETSKDMSQHTASQIATRIGDPRLQYLANRYRSRLRSPWLEGRLEWVTPDGAQVIHTYTDEHPVRNVLRRGALADWAKDRLLAERGQLIRGETWTGAVVGPEAGEDDPDLQYNRTSLQLRDQLGREVEWV